MSITGLLIHPIREQCPYIKGYEALNETLLIRHLSNGDMDMLLSMGFRHFGDIFFRPICRHCHSCIPIRIPVRGFKPTRSVKRLLNRAKKLSCKLEKPVPTQEGFEVYKKHKKRFQYPPSTMSESFEHYARSFFHPFGFNRSLVIRDGKRLVAVSHLDVTGNSMSAVYCYFDNEYDQLSPGKLAIYKELELAREMGIMWLYLGYYVPQNRHMKYKIDYKPIQLLECEHRWRDYKDADGMITGELPVPEFRLLADYKGLYENNTDEDDLTSEVLE